MKDTLIFIFVLALLVGLGVLLKETKDYHTTKETIYTMPLEIKSLKEFSDLMEMLHSAKTGDVIRIKNAGYGGTAVTGISIANAIKASKARVIIDVVGGSYSAHAIISCAADTLNIEQGAFLMFHTLQMPDPDAGPFSGGMIPVDYTNADTGAKIMIDYIRSKCKHLVSELNMEAMIYKGAEIYVYTQEGRLKSNMESK